MRGPLPVPRGEDAVVLGRPRQGSLLLLRLPPGRRHLQVPDAGRAAVLPRGGRSTGPTIRGQAAARQPGGAAAPGSRPTASGRCSKRPSSSSSTGSARRTPAHRRAASSSGAASTAPPGASSASAGRPTTGDSSPRRSVERHPEGALIDAGLTVQPDSGNTPYDRFRNRITFPIRSADGRLDRLRRHGSSATVSPSTSTAPRARSSRSGRPCSASTGPGSAAGDAGELLVVEGYFDCLSLHRVGIPNAVATLGTALTQEHARLLRRRLGDGGRVVLCYDADEAGRRAALTGARVLLEAGVDVAVLVLPHGTDPDDIVRDRRRRRVPRAPPATRRRCSTSCSPICPNNPE